MCWVGWTSWDWASAGSLNFGPGLGLLGFWKGAGLGRDQAERGGVGLRGEEVLTPDWVTRCAIALGWDACDSARLLSGAVPSPRCGYLRPRGALL